MIEIIKKRAISTDFASWLAGIEEDDPLPFEIEFVYFIYETKNNNLTLSYSASEKELHIFDYAKYCPLEAQFFDSQTLKQLSKEIFEKKLDVLLTELTNFLKRMCLNSKNRFSFLKDKKILFGKRFDIILNKYKHKWINIKIKFEILFRKTLIQKLNPKSQWYQVF